MTQGIKLLEPMRFTASSSYSVSLKLAAIDLRVLASAGSAFTTVRV